MSGIVAGFLQGAAGAGAKYLGKEIDAQIAKEAEEHRQAFLKATQERGFAHTEKMEGSRQTFQKSEREAGQEFTSGENKANRDQQLEIAKMHEAGANARTGATIAASDRRLASDEKKFGAESKRAAELLEAQLKTQGLEQGVANLKLYAAEQEQRLRAQYQSQVENGDKAGAADTKRTLEVLTGKAKDKFVVTPYKTKDEMGQESTVGVFVTDTTNGSVKFQSLGQVGVPSEPGSSAKGGDRPPLSAFSKVPPNQGGSAPQAAPSKPGIVEGAAASGVAPSPDEYKDVLTKLKGSQLMYGKGKTEAWETALQWINQGKVTGEQARELESAMGQ